MSHDPLYPAFSDAEYERRYREVRARMDSAGVSTLLLFGRGGTPEIHYLCNWQTTTEAWLVFPREGDSTLFVQLSNHLPNARRMAIIDDVRFGGSSPVGSVDSVPTVVEHLKERGLERARIGIVGGIPYQQYNATAGVGRPCVGPLPWPIPAASHCGDNDRRAHAGACGRAPVGASEWVKGDALVGGPDRTIARTFEIRFSLAG